LGDKVENLIWGFIASLVLDASVVAVRKEWTSIWYLLNE
jgi:hypothetical protein